MSMRFMPPKNPLTEHDFCTCLSCVYICLYVSTYIQSHTATTTTKTRFDLDHANTLLLLLAESTTRRQALKNHETCLCEKHMLLLREDAAAVAHTKHVALSSFRIAIVVGNGAVKAEAETQMIMRATDQPTIHFISLSFIQFLCAVSCCVHSQHTSCTTRRAHLRDLRCQRPTTTEIQHDAIKQGKTEREREGAARAREQLDYR